MRSSSFANGTRYHALGGPSEDDPATSKRAYDANHADVPQNISNTSIIDVTELVSHSEMSALNANAPSNMYLMVVTELVSHSEMSALKEVAFLNIYCMSVTKLTSQEGISSQPATPHRRSETFGR